MTDKPACDECRDAEEIPCEEGCMGEDPDCDRCNGNGVVPCPSCQED